MREVALLYHITAAVQASPAQALQRGWGGHRAILHTLLPRKAPVLQNISVHF